MPAYSPVGKQMIEKSISKLKPKLEGITIKDLFYKEGFVGFNV